MGRLPRELEEKRQRLARAARRGAFDSYVRHGRVPHAYARIAEAMHEAKNLSESGVAATPQIVPKLPAGRPTSHYTWRTAGDDRVRGTHAALNGRVFSWSNPPAHGHPGHELNCRCWPEPYYGDPAVPDALLALAWERRNNADPGVLWASIETLTRPDGSLAASNIMTKSGATARSTFVGSAVTTQVTLPTGDTVRIEHRSGTSTTYVGEDAMPLLQTRWTAAGPTVARTRRRLAFLMDDPLGPDVYFDPIQTDLAPNPIFDREPMGGFFSLDSPEGPGIVGAVLLLLYLMRQAEPAAMGAGERDAAYVAFRAWTNGTGPEGRAIPVPIAVGSVTEEQARESCKLLPDVQAWTDLAALTLAGSQASVNGQQYGIRLHTLVKGEVDARKADSPFIYRGVSAEYSILKSGLPGAYGEIDTRRLDVIEVVPPEEPTVICDYEIKTGGAQLGGRQLAEYVARLVGMYPGATIFIFQVKPTLRPPR